MAAPRETSVLGLISGAVAGLGTVTAASGYILPWHGAVIGVLAGAVCFFASTEIKRMLGYDDTLDVFGVHAGHWHARRGYGARLCFRRFHRRPAPGLRASRPVWPR